MKPTKPGTVEYAFGYLECRHYSNEDKFSKQVTGDPSSCPVCIAQVRNADFFA